MGAADPASERHDPGAAHGRGGRPRPPGRRHRGPDRVRPLRRQAPAGAAPPLRPAAQAAELGLPRRPLRGLRLPVPPPRHPPGAARRPLLLREVRQVPGRQVRAKAAPPLPGDDEAVRLAVRVRGRPPPARLRLRSRPLPRPRARARLRVLRRRPRRRRDRGGAPEAQRQAHVPRRSGRRPGDRGRWLRRHHDVVGPGPSRRAGRGPDDAPAPAGPGRRPAPAHRQRRLAQAQAPARGVGRVHPEPPHLLLPEQPAAPVAARRVRQRRDAAVVRRARRARQVAPQRAGAAPPPPRDRPRQPRQHAPRGGLRRSGRPAALGARGREAGGAVSRPPRPPRRPAPRSPAPERNGARAAASDSATPCALGLRQPLEHERHRARGIGVDGDVLVHVGEAEADSPPPRRARR